MFGYAGKQLVLRPRLLLSMKRPTGPFNETDRDLNNILLNQSSPEFFA